MHKMTSCLSFLLRTRPPSQFHTRSLSIFLFCLHILPLLQFVSFIKCVVSGNSRLASSFSTNQFLDETASSWERQSLVQTAECGGIYVWPMKSRKNMGIPTTAKAHIIMLSKLNGLEVSFSVFMHKIQVEDEHDIEMRGRARGGRPLLFASIPRTNNCA